MLKSVKAAVERLLIRLIEQATAPLTRELLRMRRDIFNSPFMGVRCIYPLREGDRAVINLTDRTVTLATMTSGLPARGTSILIVEARRDIPEGHIVPFNMNNEQDIFTPFRSIVRLV